MKRHKKLISLAIEQAKDSTVRYQMGCVLTQRTTIISAGHNRSTGSIPYQVYGTHYISSSYGFIHAEVDALLQVLPGLNAKLDCRTTAYIAGLSPAGNVLFSKPCKGCQTVLKMCGIRRVYYATPDGIEFLRLGLKS